MFPKDALYFGTIFETFAETGPFAKDEAVHVSVGGRGKGVVWVAGTISKEISEEIYDVNVDGRTHEVATSDILGLSCNIEFTHMIRRQHRGGARQARVALNAEQSTPGWRHEHNMPLADVEAALIRLRNLWTPIEFKDGEDDDIKLVLANEGIEIHAGQEEPELVSKLGLSKPGGSDLTGIDAEGLAIVPVPLPRKGRVALQARIRAMAADAGMPPF